MKRDCLLFTSVKAQLNAFDKPSVGDGPLARSAVRCSAVALYLGDEPVRRVLTEAQANCFFLVSQQSAATILRVIWRCLIG